MDIFISNQNLNADAMMALTIIITMMMKQLPENYGGNNDNVNKRRTITAQVGTQSLILFYFFKMAEEKYTRDDLH